MFPGLFNFLGEVSPGFLYYRTLQRYSACSCPFPAPHCFPQQICTLSSNSISFSCFCLQTMFSSYERPCFPFCILSQVLFSCIHFPGLFHPLIYHFFKYTCGAALRVASGTCSYLQHRHTRGHRCICEELHGNLEKAQAPKVWRRPARYRLFRSAALTLLIANSRLSLMLCCRGEPCLGHDLLLNFQQYVNISGQTVSTPTEMVMPLVDMCHASAAVTHV